MPKFLFIICNYTNIPLKDHFLTALDSKRLMCFYLTNKTVFDTRPDLVIRLLTRISESNRPAPRKRNASPTYCHCQCGHYNLSPSYYPTSPRYSTGPGSPSYYPTSPRYSTGSPSWCAPKECPPSPTYNFE